jgi:hypothetical protein
MRNLASCLFTRLPWITRSFPLPESERLVTVRKVQGANRCQSVGYICHVLRCWVPCDTGWRAAERCTRASAAKYCQDNSGHERKLVTALPLWGTSVANGSEARQNDSPQRHRGTEARSRTQRRWTSALSLPVEVFFLRFSVPFASVVSPTCLLIRPRLDRTLSSRLGPAAHRGEQLRKPFVLGRRTLLRRRTDTPA